MDVVGDSHLARLFKSGERLPFEVDLAQWCRGGASLSYLESIIDRMEWEELQRSPQVSDLTVVFLGGNDLDRPNLVVCDLVSSYATQLRRLSQMGTEVVVLTQFPRPGARIGGVNFWTNAVYFDHLLTLQSKGDFRTCSWDPKLRPHGEFDDNGDRACTSV